MRIPPFMVLSMAIAAGGCLTGCQRQKPAPSIDSLSAVLEKAAETTLPAPTLADEQIVLHAKPGQAAAQVAEVSRAFSAAGAVAITSSNGLGGISIIAEIPTANIAPFKAMLRHEKADTEKGSSPTSLIEVLIDTTTPSPTP